MVARLGLFVACWAIVVLIGWVDLVTGPDYGMSLFYLAPIVTIARFAGLRAGVALAVSAAVLWFLCELETHTGTTLAAMIWNGFTRLVIYVGAATIVALLRTDRNRLRELLRAAEETARTDVLTQLANSRAFHERLREEVARIARYRRPLTIAYVDIDNFKRVNDKFGHARGDDVLVEIAQVLRSVVRAGDLPARLGGDEFAIALWETTPDQLGAFERRLAEAIEPLAARYPGTGLGASIGFAQLGPDAALEQVLKAADDAMYAAKARRKAAVAATT